MTASRRARASSSEMDSGDFPATRVSKQVSRRKRVSGGPRHGPMRQRSEGAPHGRPRRARAWRGGLWRSLFLALSSQPAPPPATFCPGSPPHTSGRAPRHTRAPAPAERGVLLPALLGRARLWAQVEAQARFGGHQKRRPGAPRRPCGKATSGAESGARSSSTPNRTRPGQQPNTAQIPTASTLSSMGDAAAGLDGAAEGPRPKLLVEVERSSPSDAPHR